MAPTDVLPPGPTFHGRLSYLSQQAGFLFDSFGVVAGRFARYGDLYHVRSDGPGLFVVRHPDHLRDVLVTHASKYTKTHSAFRQLATVLGDGLLTSDGDAWRRQRRLVQPAFSRQRLEGYAVAMTDEARRAVEGWRDGDAPRASPRHDGAHPPRRQPHPRATTSRATWPRSPARCAPSRHVPLAARPPAGVDALALRARSERAVAALDRIIYGMIDRRRDGGAPAGPVDLLQMLVTAVDEEGDGGGLSRQEMRDQLVTLFLAGHETTSHALTWTLYLLSQNPSAERALHAELDAALGGRDPTVADLDALPWTEQVLKESMPALPPGVHGRPPRRPRTPSSASTPSRAAARWSCGSTTRTATRGGSPSTPRFAPSASRPPRRRSSHASRGSPSAPGPARASGGPSR